MEFVNFVSKIGVMRITADLSGVTEIRFSKGKSKSTNNVYLLNAIQQLEEYFDGKRKNFDFSMSILGTDFQQKIWKTLKKVDYGETITYGKLAKQAGFPKAYRAVGNAMNANPLCVVVPCHRVVGVTNKYNYAAGSQKKKWLLEHES